MIEIRFVTSELTKQELKGLSAMLTHLAWSDVPEKDATIHPGFGQPGWVAPSKVQEAEAVGGAEVDPTMTSQEAATSPEASSDDTLKTSPDSGQKGKRGRPRKEFAGVTPEVHTPTLDASALIVAAGTPVEPLAVSGASSSSSAQAPTLESLRANLKDFTAKNGMQAGIDLLKSFGCGRVSDLVALPLETQSDFAQKATA